MGMQPLAFTKVRRLRSELRHLVRMTSDPHSDPMDYAEGCNPGVLMLLLFLLIITCYSLPCVHILQWVQPDTYVSLFVFDPPQVYDYSPPMNLNTPCRLGCPSTIIKPEPPVIELHKPEVDQPYMYRTLTRTSKPSTLLKILSYKEAHYYNSLLGSPEATPTTTNVCIVHMGPYSLNFMLVYLHAARASVKNTRTATHTGLHSVNSMLVYLRAARAPVKNSRIAIQMSFSLIQYLTRINKGRLFVGDMHYCYMTYGYEYSYLYYYVLQFASSTATGGSSWSTSEAASKDERTIAGAEHHPNQVLSLRVWSGMVVSPYVHVCDDVICIVLRNTLPTLFAKVQCTDMYRLSTPVNKFTQAYYPINMGNVLHMHSDNTKCQKNYDPYGICCRSDCIYALTLYTYKVPVANPISVHDASNTLYRALYPYNRSLIDNFKHAPPVYTHEICLLGTSICQVLYNLKYDEMYLIVSYVLHVLQLIAITMYMAPHWSHGGEDGGWECRPPYIPLRVAPAVVPSPPWHRRWTMANATTLGLDRRRCLQSTPVRCRSRLLIAFTYDNMYIEQMLYVFEYYLLIVAKDKEEYSTCLWYVKCRTLLLGYLSHRNIYYPIGNRVRIYLTHSWASHLWPNLTVVMLKQYINGPQETGHSLLMSRSYDTCNKHGGTYNNYLPSICLYRIVMLPCMDILTLRVLVLLQAVVYADYWNSTLPIHIRDDHDLDSRNPHRHPGLSVYIVDNTSLHIELYTVPWTSLRHMCYHRQHAYIMTLAFIPSPQRMYILDELECHHKLWKEPTPPKGEMYALLILKFCVMWYNHVVCKGKGRSSCNSVLFTNTKLHEKYN